MKMRWKIYLFSTVWLVVVMLVVCLSIYTLFENELTEREEDRVAQQTEQVAEALQTSSGTVPPRQLLPAYLPADGMIRVIEGEQDGGPLVVTKDRTIADLPLLYATEQRTVIRRLEGETYLTSTFPILTDSGAIATLEVTENVSDTFALLDILRLVLWIAGFAVLVPSVIAGKLLGDLILKPIHSFTRTMENIQHEGQFQRLHLEGKSKDELYQLGITFNHMMTMLEENYYKQEQFVSDASHELKTPLTAIESYATLLKRWGMKKPEVLEESVDAIYAEALRMREMTQQMLELASDGNQRLDKASFQAADLIEESMKTMRRAYERSIEWQATPPEVTVLADASKLKQVLFILLDNAIKFSDTKIEVALSETNSHLGIAINDHGVGIPDEDIAHVFERFYRVDKARSRKTGGTGLGLSIAQRIIAAHGGHIDVQSTQGEGTTFTIWLPTE
ncbi:sensor histidine kinase [Aureibacillus halotolerans]|uniref:histidine kinase n=1 Tax=Aureibacillus halotolerans TaxID=1508390 RepID=A0A4R6TZD4_9BACI|nr:HAMP domain-containing sensor histidine kinase [Aureibacillus halotolerans]TDQ37429.1 hypothetical protein EV213_11364 [Aureibacillus halotolerans]